MITLWKSIAVAVALPFAFVGCTSPNPTSAFNDVEKNVSSRTEHDVRWLRSDADRDEIESAVSFLLKTNLTAQTAVAIALLNNRSLQADFEEIGISQAELAQASRLKNPQFDGFWRLPTRGSAVVNAEYSLAQDFLDLLTLPARKKIAAQNLEAVKLRIAHRVLMLAEEVQVAFYAFQSNQQLTNRLAIIVEVNEAAADVAKRQHDAGNINDLEFQSQQTAYSQSFLDIARAVTQLRADRERVNRLLGLWGQQTTWVAAAGLPPLPGDEPALENIEAAAVSRRLDLAAARRDLITVQGALKLKKSVRWIPAVNIGVNAEHETDHTWVLGPTLGLEIPIFDQGQPELARLAAEYRRASRNFEALAINIRSEVREARDALIAARNTAEYYQKVLLPQRQRLLRETLLQYNAMQVSNYALLAAKEREALAERETIEALRDYWMARARLQTAVGGNPSDDKSAPQHNESSHHDHKP